MTRATRREVLGAAALAAVGCATTRPRMIEAVRWAWTGGVTSNSANVVARVEGAKAVTLVVRSHRNAEGDRGMRVTPASGAEDTYRFVLSDLEPDHRYTLHLEADAEVVWTGAVRTHREDQPLSFAFVAGSCAQTGSAHDVFETMKRHDPRVFVHLGDLHYEDIDEDSPARFAAAYDLVLTSPTQASLAAEVPVAYVWDDHDFGRNNSDRNSPSKRAALAAYRAHVPSHPLVDDQAIYHAFTIGRVRFLMTDCRSQRTPRGTPHRYRTLLGKKQKAWLKQELLDSKGRYPLVVWVSPVGWIGKTLDDDSWPGYPSERTELALFLAEHGIENVLMLAGDAHMLAIDDGTNNTYAQDGRRGFPVFHVAALDQVGSEKGGPYSHGVQIGRGQYGLIEIEDRVAEMSVRLTGRDAEDAVLIEHTFVLPG